MLVTRPAHLRPFTTYRRNLYAARVSRPWFVSALVLLGVVVSVSMIVLGWPEENPAQIVLLELASLPLQAAVGVGLWYLSHRMLPLGRRGRVAGWIAAGLAVAGLGLVGAAYLGPRGLVHPGLALIWTGLLLAMVLVVTHLPRRRMRELFRVLPDDEEDEDTPGDDESSAGTPLPAPQDDPGVDPSGERSAAGPGPEPTGTPA